MEKVTIGADPEFVIRIPGTTELISGDEISEHNGMLGTDAVDTLMELRPRPSLNVFNVLGNMRFILRFLLDKSPKLKGMEFIAGHKGVHYAIGGHIHIGRNSKQPWFNQVNYLDDQDAGHLVLNVLDKLLYDGLHKTIQDTSGYYFRVSRSYGLKGAYRSGHRKHLIEYRTPPSWLVSPTLAFTYLGLAKLSGLLSLNDKAVVRTLLHKKTVGINLLKYIANIVSINHDIMAEPDMAKLITIIKAIPYRKLQVSNWQRDFKKAWGL